MSRSATEDAGWSDPAAPGSTTTPGSAYDGDGKTDVGVFRPSSAIWYMRNSGGTPMTVINWGLDGDYPISDPPARS